LNRVNRCCCSALSVAERRKDTPEREVVAEEEAEEEEEAWAGDTRKLAVVCDEGVLGAALEEADVSNPMVCLGDCGGDGPSGGQP
jgi:hypothetical protein